MIDKNEQREHLKSVLGQLGAEQIVAASQSITPHLLTDPLVTRASTILAYAAFATELSLDPFIAAAIDANMTIAVPDIDWAHKSMAARRITNLDTDLIPGRYDIRVPCEGCALVEPEQIDLIILPGLAFDRAGNRLGRGAGFYDRYINALEESGHRPARIGVCHHAQIVTQVPTETHDHPVDRVITELGPIDPV